MSELQFELQGRVKGADRAVLLAHGAGADMHAAALVVVADALADARIPSMRFDFPYRSAGRRAPDRPAVLEATVRDAAAELARRTKLPTARLVVGGRSMGGRYASMVAADADDPLDVLGVLLLGYPLHPAGKPHQLRVDHFPRLHVPCLFVSGTRDNLAPRDGLTAASRAIRGPVTRHWLESADHGFRPLKASGRSSADVLDEVAGVSVDWVRSLAP